MVKLVYDEQAPIRLDLYLSKTHQDISRSYISKQIEDGKIKVNGVSVKPSQKLKSGDIVNFDSRTIVKLKPKVTKLPVIYEDDFCIVINKPSGVITHTKGVMSDESSVASFISDKIDQTMTGNRAGIVHRLDRGTSGVLIAAKTTASLKYLQRQFAKRQVHKTYLAIVKGNLTTNEAKINMPIERNPKQPATFRVGLNGKPAETKYQVLAGNDQYSLLKLTPLTGRTHQLRVHLNAIGHPIVGDNLYGGEPAERLMLHALELEVILPDKGRTTFSAPIPTIFNYYVKI